MQASVKRQLQQMDDYDFEHFVAELWEQMGWECDVSQASVDAGIDVTATKTTPYPQKKLIQAKRYGPNTKVGGPDIQQYASLKHQRDGVDSVVVVTSNRFTSAARTRARELNVKLVDGDDLAELVSEFEAYGALEKYLESDFSTVNETSFSESAESSTLEVDGQESETRSFRNVMANLSPDVRVRLVHVGTVAWGLAWLFGLLDIETGGVFGGIFSLTVLASWVLLPAAMYYDSVYVDGNTSWSPYRRLYALGGAIPFFNSLVGALYLYRRHTTRHPQNKVRRMVEDRLSAASDEERHGDGVPIRFEDTNTSTSKRTETEHRQRSNSLEFDEVWTELVRYAKEESTVYTFKQRRENELSYSVTQDAIVFDSEKPNSIPRDTWKKAWEQLQEEGELTISGFKQATGTYRASVALPFLADALDLQSDPDERRIWL